MRPLARVFDLYCDAWFSRAEAKAWREPEWAQIQRRRIIDGQSGTVMFAEDLGLDLELWERQDEIFERINPRPVLLRLGMWWRCETGRWIIRPKVAYSYLQRARRGHSDRDTWNLGAYLVDVIAGSVERFAELTNGHPAELTPEEWDDILAQISGGIRSAVQRLNDSDLDKEGHAQAEADLVASLHLLCRWQPHLSW